MIDRSSPPEPGPPPVIQPLRPVRTGLPNGLQIVLLSHRGLPEVAFRLVVPAGADSIPAETAGMAALVGKLLPEGASGRGAREMAAWVDGLGMHLGIGVGYDAAIVRAHTLSHLCRETLDVLAAVATSPDFALPEVERCRAEQVDAIARRSDDPEQVAADLLAELLYGTHPYGRLPQGRAESVRQLDREAIVAFHEVRYAPAAATLVACGDLDPGSLVRMVEDRFGSWDGPVPGTDPPSAPAAPDTPGITLFDRPGSRQSVIRIAGIGLARGDDGEPCARIMNAILGGLFNSRLNLNLREDKGWTYGARSTLALRRSAGPLTIRAAVETGVTVPALREMLREIQALQDAAPGPEEMGLAADALTRSLPLRFETASQLADRLVEQVVYALPDDHWSSLPGRIAGVSAAEVHAMARRLTEAAGLVILVVGDATAVQPGIEEIGPVTRGCAP